MFAREYQERREEIEEALRSQPDQLEHWTRALVMNDLDRNIAQIQSASTIGLVLPENIDRDLIPAYLKGFLDGLDAKLIAEILKDGARLPESVSTRLAGMRVPIRDIRTLERPVVLRGDRQTVVPSAL